MYKTNVLHIIDTLGIGGAEKVMVGVVNGLPEMNHHVVYLSGSDALASSLPKDCTITKLNYSSKLHLFKAVVSLRKYIKRNNISIVHSHLPSATLVARLACPRNVKLFTTIHSLASKNYFAESRIAKLLEKLTYRKHHHIIAICQEVFNDYKKCIGIKGPYTVLYNYIDDINFRSDFRKMNFNGSFRMVSVGNLKRAKNYPFLVEAFKQMPKNISLDIYGAGPLHDQLKIEIEKHNLNIRLCGVREDIHNVLPAYDAFIMSSIFEGQPISLLEAMACGIPAVLSDIPVLREVTNSNAVFFNLDNTDDLVQKLTAIANHEVDLNEHAAANFERVRKIANKDNYMFMLKKVYMEHEVYRTQVYKIPAVKIFKPVLPSPAS
jgi:glycosyltransferase involved in cell wall biosynthesis